MKWLWLSLPQLYQMRWFGIKTTLFENKLQQHQALKMVAARLPATLVTCLRRAKQKCHRLTQLMA